MKLSYDAGSMLLGHSAAHTNFGDAESNEADPMGDDPAIPPKDASPMQLRIGSWMEQSKLPSAFLAVFYLLSLKQWSVMGVRICLYQSRASRSHVSTVTVALYEDPCMSSDN